MARPGIAIATCAGYADLKAGDDLLREELAARGVESAAVVWDRMEGEMDGFDACLVRSTWDYHEKYEEFLAWARRVEAAIPLWNDAQTIAWNSNKTYLRELAEGGVRIVPTLWVEQGERPVLDELLVERGWDEAVVKPVVDLGARNLSRVRAADIEGQKALERVLERHGAMVQPFLPSLEEQGELSLIYVAGQFSHAVRKRPAPGDFRVQSIWGGSVKRAEPTAEHLELAKRALSQVIPTPLYARADLVEDLAGDPCLIELELIEPNLYLSHQPGAAGLLADALLERLER
ncbi:MAG: ATP-grasp domain-containing protein [Solirubrobacterales bacterium]